MTPLLGDDVADLHRLADEQDCTWVNVHGLPAPYMVDRVARIVYLDGRLGLARYYEALGQGLAEMVAQETGANILTLRPKTSGSRRGTG